MIEKEKTLIKTKTSNLQKTNLLIPVICLLERLWMLWYLSYWSLSHLHFEDLSGKNLFFFEFFLLRAG